jgi:hypothetical protein
MINLKKISHNEYRIDLVSDSVILTSCQLVYNKNTNLSVKDIYLLAQRDTYYFGILIYNIVI